MHNVLPSFIPFTFSRQLISFPRRILLFDHHLLHRSRAGFVESIAGIAGFDGIRFWAGERSGQGRSPVHGRASSNLRRSGIEIDHSTIGNRAD